SEWRCPKISRKGGGGSAPSSPRSGQAAKSPSRALACRSVAVFAGSKVPWELLPRSRLLRELTPPPLSPAHRGRGRVVRVLFFAEVERAEGDAGRRPRVRAEGRFLKQMKTSNRSAAREVAGGRTRRPAQKLYSSLHLPALL